MASQTAVNLLRAALIGGAGYAAYKIVNRNKKAAPAGGGGGSVTTDASCLAGIFQAGAGVSAKIRTEMNDVALAFLDSLDATTEGSTVSINANVQYPAWAHALYLAGEPAGRTRDEKIQDLLETAIAPGCDWSTGLDPYTYDQPQSAVWRGAGVLLDLASAQRSV